MIKPMLTPKALEELKQDINQQIEEYCDRGNYSVAAGLVRALATIVEYQTLGNLSSDK